MISVYQTYIKKKFLQEQLRRRQQCFECCSEHGVTTPDVAAAAVGQDGVIIAKKIANEPVMTFRRVLFGLRSTDAATIDNRERRVAVAMLRAQNSPWKTLLRQASSCSHARTHARAGGRAVQSVYADYLMRRRTVGLSSNRTTKTREYPCVSLPVPVIGQL